MEVKPGYREGTEEGFVREWSPCSHILSLIPPRIQNGIFSSELNLTCVDAVTEYIALGTNVGLVYWFDRKKGNIQRLRCENTSSPITFVKIASTVDFMVGAGNAAGQVTVFQVPREHPDTIPQALRPKGDAKVERYTIGDLHRSRVTAIEWSKNGMRLFSGDQSGVIIMTEIDFYMHLCKSMEIVNEAHEIVQLSYWTNSLLVSSAYRTIVCERDGAKWTVSQIGTKERKSLCRLGAVFQHSYARGGSAALYCARPGLRLWRADHQGTVLQTLLFKEAISNPLTIAELLNPCTKKIQDVEHTLGPLYVFRDKFLVSHNERVLYVLDPHTATAVAVVDDLRRILSVSVHKEEVFILEGPRSLIRLAHTPEQVVLPEDPMNLMAKSLTISIQHAVNAMRDITIDTTQHITSVLEPLSLFNADNITKADECFELPPIKNLPNDLSCNVLESIINEFHVASDDENKLSSEEIQSKFKLYNKILEEDKELIHSRRSRRCGPGSSGGSTPRALTPVRNVTSTHNVEVSYNTSTLMSVSGYGDIPLQNDELIEKQIEEKEKILAKMLNLDSLGSSNEIIDPNQDDVDSVNHPGDKKPVQNTQKSVNENDSDAGDTRYNRIDAEIGMKTVMLDITDNHDIKPVKHDIKTYNLDIKPVELDTKTKANPDVKPTVDVKTARKDGDLVPKVLKLPNTWNLDDIELKIDLQNSYKSARNAISPDCNLEEWEFV